MVGLVSQTMNTGNPLGDIKTYDPAQITLDQQEDTVSGQMNTLLRQDSPILQQARTYAKQQANRTGTLNSSMTGGAIFGAMMDRALPIAKQDASTYYGARKENTGAQNRAFEFGAGASNVAGAQLYAGKTPKELQEAEHGFKAGESALGREHETSLITADQTWSTSENLADRALQKTLQGAQLSHEESQAGLGRALQERMQSSDQTWRTSESFEDRALQKYMQGEQLTFEETEAVLNRALQETLQTADQTWRTGEAALDRTQQTSLQDDQQSFATSEAALDRTQQTSIQNDEQSWRTGESALDRAQDVSEADLDRLLKEVLQDDMQLFTSSQDDLTRAIQQSEIDDRAALSILESNQLAINNILTDPNLGPTEKSTAIANIINGSMANLDFYNKLKNSGSGGTGKYPGSGGDDGTPTGPGGPGGYTSEYDDAAEFDYYRASQGNYGHGITGNKQHYFIPADFNWTDFVQGDDDLSQAFGEQSWAATEDEWATWWIGHGAKNNEARFTTAFVPVGGTDTVTGGGGNDTVTGGGGNDTVTGGGGNDTTATFDWDNPAHVTTATSIINEYIATSQTSDALFTRLKEIFGSGYSDVDFYAGLDALDYEISPIGGLQPKAGSTTEGGLSAGEQQAQDIVAAHLQRDATAKAAGEEGSGMTPEEAQNLVSALKGSGYTIEQIAQFGVENYGGDPASWIGAITELY